MATMEMEGRICDTSGKLSIEWTLDKYISVPFAIFSPAFMFLDATWYLQFEVSSESKDCTPNKFRIFFTMIESRSEHHFVKFTLGIKNLSGKIYGARSGEMLFESNADKQEEEESYAELEILVNDSISFKETLIIYCIASCPELINRKEAESQTLPNDDLDVLSQEFANLFLKEQCSDVSILVGKRDYRVHKSVIIARSPVFATMFEEDMKEKQTGIVTISDCDPDAFRDFLYYLYSGKVDKLSEEKVVDLYSIAHKYDVNLLIRQCLQFMTDSISAESFCDYLSLAIKYSESDLLELSTEFFVKNAEKIIITKRWSDFMDGNKTVVNELLIKLLAKRCNTKSE